MNPTNTPSARPLSRFRHYWQLYAMLWRNSVVREMGFKSNFLLWIVVEVLWFGLQLAFIAVIYQHTERIGDWTKWEVVLLMGAAQFIQQIFQTFFFTNITQISELIRTGKLDFMLLLPANTRFLISLRQVDLGGFVNGAFALAVMVYSLRQLEYLPSAAQIIGFFLLVIAGVLTHYALMFLLATTSFWTVRAQGIVWGYYSFFNIARLPDAAFRGFFKAFFTFALPFLLLANVPAKLVVKKLESPEEMILLVAMMVACLILSEIIWRFSLKHYTSASS
jgi:ABC-2 type transport system permease protein